MWPFIVHTDDLSIPNYLVINSLVFCIGVFWIFKRAGQKKINQNAALDVALYVMIGGFIGARGFHILFEYPSYYWHHLDQILKFWNGGFVYYGGAIGAMVAAWIKCRISKYDFLVMGDLFAPALALGTSLGRLGCLAAGCCYGLPTIMPWGITFPPGVEAPSGIALHPTQIYSSLWEFVALLILLVCERRLPRKGQLFGLWLLLHGLGRAIIEQFRGDFRGPSPFNLSISTWVSALAIIFGLWLFARISPKERRT